MHKRYAPIVAGYYLYNRLFPISAEKTTIEKNQINLSFLEEKNRSLTYAREDPACINALSRAVSFLEKAQRASGEFAVWEGHSPDLHDGKIDSSPFASTFVLHSLDFVRDPRVPRMKYRALVFILENSEEGLSTWRYWSKSNWKYGRLLRTDVDDTCVCRSALLENNISFSANAFLPVQNKNGSFPTWLGSPFDGWPPFQTVDGVVNANAARYLRMTGVENPALENYLLSLVHDDKKCQTALRHYLLRESFHYAFSRAFAADSRMNILWALQKIKKEIIAVASQEKMKTCTDFQAALMACTLHSAGGTLEEIYPFISSLLQRQQEDGAWRPGSFYVGLSPHYGSSELTTALGIEAIGGYLLHL